MRRQWVWGLGCRIGWISAVLSRFWNQVLGSHVEAKGSELDFKVLRGVFTGSVNLLYEV